MEFLQSIFVFLFPYINLETYFLGLGIVAFCTLFYFYIDKHIQKNNEIDDEAVFFTVLFGLFWIFVVLFFAVYFLNIILNFFGKLIAAKISSK